MTAHRTSIVSHGGSPMPPTTPIASEAETRLLKKLHTIRPMLADRNSRKNVAAFPPIPPI